jgi:virginiamycin B lyase
VLLLTACWWSIILIALLLNRNYASEGPKTNSSEWGVVIHMAYRSVMKFLSLSFLLTITIAVVAAKETVVIEEWDVPTPNSRPHDPASAPDGSLWYTGMHSNTLGRLNPASGKIKEYQLKTPDSGPHGLVTDKEGDIWFTANYKSYIGKLDPHTGDVQEFPMPDPAAEGPHTPVFDHKGVLWFTVEKGNFVGRLDPVSGTIRLKRLPTPHSIPYGIAVNSAGIPFFCEFGTNKLASISPDTMGITEYPLPEGARPRRIAITADDIVYFTDYAQGRLGRFDPKSKKVGEWASPGGSSSAPYGIAVTPDGNVWYSESGVQPNTIVCFDPKTKTFQSWPVPSGGGVIRNMAATPSGDIYIACSGKNKVGIVRITH